MAYDQYWDSVITLLHGEGADGGTTFTDSAKTPKTYTRSGNTNTATAQYKFGAASLYFDGVGDKLAATHADFALGTGDFTVEFWYYSTAAATESQVLFQIGTSSTAGILQLYRNITTHTLQCNTYTSSYQTAVLSSLALGDNAWHHVALVRVATTYTLYFNGVNAGSSTQSLGADLTLTTLHIGSNSSAAFEHKGYIDDFRITKGLARYAADFSAPTEAFADGRGLLLSPAAFVYTANPNRFYPVIIPAETGAFTLGASVAELLHNRTMTPGVFTLTGSALTRVLPVQINDTFALDPIQLFTGIFKNASAVTFADVARKSAIFRVGETLGLADRFGLSIEALARTVDTLGLDETLLYIAKAMARQGLNVMDTSPTTTVRLLIMAEVLALASNATMGMERYGRILETLLLDETLLYTARAMTLDGLNVHDASATTTLRILLAAEALALASASPGRLEIYGRILDSLPLDETLLYTARATARQGLNVLDTSPTTTLRLLRVAEALALVGNAPGHLEIYGRLLEALSLDEVADAAFGMTAADRMTLAAALTNAIEARKVAADTVALASAVRTALVIVTHDTVTLDEAQGVTLTAALLAADRLAFVGSLPLGEDDYQMWVLNAENLGVTQYTQVPFNSLVTHEGRSYGVNEIGLYELEGEDDAGTDIDAYIRTGMLDFGSATPKRMVRAYMYLRADDEVLLKVVADANGRRSAVWYRLATRETDTLYNRRIKLGRGIEARSWGLEVSNVDGGSLDLRDFRVLPVILRGRPV